MAKRNNRAEVLRLLSKSPTEKMTLRYIATTLDMKTDATWTALDSLVRDGLVVKYADAKFMQYRLNLAEVAV